MRSPNYYKTIIEASKCKDAQGCSEFIMHAMSLLRGIFTIILAIFVCYTHGQLECKITQLGKEYVGLKNVTISGKTCQAWSSQYPHKHTLSDNKVLRKSRNYCRNPDGEPGGPWCYTTNRNIRWEYCGIPSCPLTDDKCYEEGTFYLGKINVTETGYTCRRWDSEDSDVYQVFGQLENYCRSPDGAPFPWCLSTAPGKRWEKCRIPICGSKTTTTIPTTISVKSNQLFSNDSESPISAENYRKSIKKNTLTVEIITVVTLGCVLVLLIGIVYIILMLRQNRLQYLVQTVPSQKARHSVNNAYDIGFSDEQPIVNSHF
nr:plasminogen isoform X2 [Crassostrea gigas]